MWVPEKLAEWFGLNAEIVRTMQAELAVARAERDALKLQNSITQSNFDWLRIQVNSLQLERAQLMQKAYGIHVPAPEIVRTTLPIGTKNPTITEDIFEDVGDDMATRLGIPVFTNV